MASGNPRIDPTMLEGMVSLADGDCGEGLYIDVLLQVLAWPESKLHCTYLSFENLKIFSLTSV